MKKVFLLFKIGGLIIAPLVLLILPSDFFDKGETICPSVQLLNIQCLGCGLTRGVQHLIHFDFKAAYEFNKLSFLALPIMIYFWFIELKKSLKSHKDLQNKTSDKSEIS